MSNGAGMDATEELMGQLKAATDGLIKLQDERIQELKTALRGAISVLKVLPQYDPALAFLADSIPPLELRLGETVDVDAMLDAARKETPE